MKKAYELSVLCDCEIAIILFADSGKLFQYSSVPMEDILRKYSKYGGTFDSKTNNDMQKLIHKHKDGIEPEELPDQKMTIQNDKSLPTCEDIGDNMNALVAATLGTGTIGGDSSIISSASSNLCGLPTAISVSEKYARSTKGPSIILPRRVPGTGNNKIKDVSRQKPVGDHEFHHPSPKITLPSTYIPGLTQLAGEGKTKHKSNRDKMQTNTPLQSSEFTEEKLVDQGKNCTRSFTGTKLTAINNDIDVDSAVRAAISAKKPKILPSGGKSRDSVKNNQNSQYHHKGRSPQSTGSGNPNAMQLDKIIEALEIIHGKEVFSIEANKNSSHSNRSAAL